MPKRPGKMRRKAGPKAASARGRRAPALQAPRTLQYKVVELSTVDEGSIEETVNLWVRQGWAFDGVQFAMRESSKRPSMAFVFFTRSEPLQSEEVAPDQEAARQRLVRLATVSSEQKPAPQQGVDDRIWSAPEEREGDPWLRLEQLAGDDEEDGP